MSHEEPTPSPYFGPEDHQRPQHHQVTGSDREFLQEIDSICREFGIKHYYIAFEDDEEIGPDLIKWKSFSNTLNENMVKYLEMIMQAMRKTWEEVKKRKL